MSFQDRINKLNKVKLMSETAIPELPELTDDSNVNTQLIMFFWWLTLLSFLGQNIAYVIQWLSGTITPLVLGILALGSANTLLIGGGVKLIQSQMSNLMKKYNAKVQAQKLSEESLAKAQNEVNALKKQLNDRDSELIAIKTKAIE
jgi:sensor histidine kinase YesM